MSKRLGLKLCSQSYRSACCGPCSIQMVANYYNIKNQYGIPYSKHQLVAICKTSKKDGTDFPDMRRALKYIGLDFSRVNNVDAIITHINNKNPVIVCIPFFRKWFNVNTQIHDEWHYCVVEGYSNRTDKLLIIDPYHGRISISKDIFKKLMRKTRNWAYVVFNQ